MPHQGTGPSLVADDSRELLACVSGRWYVGTRTPGISHYFVARSREHADEIARTAARHAPGRVWIEGDPSASGREHVAGPRPSPESVSREIERLDARVRLTPDEERRRDAALAIADPRSWRHYAASQIESIVASCARDELTIDQALDFLDRISIGCLHGDRIVLLGELAYLARRVPRAELRRTRPKYPACVRTGTAEWVLWVKAKEPALRLTPGAANREGYYNPSSPAIDQAHEILTTLNWFGEAESPSPETIDKWVRERRKQMGEQLRRARPRTNRR